MTVCVHKIYPPLRFVLLILIFATSSAIFDAKQIRICFQPSPSAQDQGGEQYVANRAAAVQDIESTIQELATMYQRLAILVKQQEEQAVRCAAYYTRTCSQHMHTS